METDARWTTIKRTVAVNIKLRHSECEIVTSWNFSDIIFNSAIKVMMEKFIYLYIGR